MTIIKAGVIYRLLEDLKDIRKGDIVIEGWCNSRRPPFTPQFREFYIAEENNPDFGSVNTSKGLVNYTDIYAALRPKNET